MILLVMPTESKHPYRYATGNSRELFFNNLADDIYSCTVTPKGQEVEIGMAQRLFHASMPGIGTSYDASPDGKGFLVNLTEGEGAAPLKIVSNWPAELKK